MEATYLTKTLRSGLTKDQVITNGACCLKPIDRERIKCEDTKFNTLPINIRYEVIFVLSINYLLNDLTYLLLYQTGYSIAVMYTTRHDELIIPLWGTDNWIRTVLGMWDINLFL